MHTFIGLVLAYIISYADICPVPPLVVVQTSEKKSSDTLSFCKTLTDYSGEPIRLQARTLTPMKVQKSPYGCRYTRTLTRGGIYDDS